MEEEKQLKMIEEAVIGILKESDLHSTTEFKVRLTASWRLGFDPSDIHKKIFIRNVVESFLLSNADHQPAQPPDEHPKAPPPDKELDSEGNHVICKLSNKRNVVVQGFKGKNFVAIREFVQKDGRQLYSNKGINLTTEQWSTFKSNVPAIDEAVTKMQAKLRSDPVSQQNGQVLNLVSACDEQNQQVLNAVTANAKQNQVISDTNGSQNQKASDTLTANGAQNDRVSSSVTAATTYEFVPIEITRFDGKNYRLWASKMESFLKQLKIVYVLTEPCPTMAMTQKAGTNEVAQARAAEQKWFNDDHMCRHNILNSLSDSLYYHYSMKTKSAKELWEELESVYLHEEFENKRTQVKKYIEFQFVDEKSILDQVQELNGIADSFGSTGGMYLDENFHVSAIISKLPPSWKDFSIKLMREEYLPFWTLMDRVRVEEGSRNRHKHGEPSNSVHSQHANNSVHSQHANNLGARSSHVKRPGMHWKRQETEMDKRGLFCYFCGKKGHTIKQCRKATEKHYKENPSTPAVTEVNLGNFRVAN